MGFNYLVRTDQAGTLNRINWPTREREIHKEVRNIGIGQLTETSYRDLLRLGESSPQTMVVMKP